MEGPGASEGVGERPSGGFERLESGGFGDALQVEDPGLEGLEAIAAHHGAVDVRALLPFAFHHCAGEGADRKAACMLAVDPVFLRDGAAAGWWQYDAHHQIVATVGTVTLRADDTDACDESSVH